VYIHYVTARDTIDAKIAKSLSGKQAAQLTLKEMI